MRSGSDMKYIQSPASFDLFQIWSLWYDKKLYKCLTQKWSWPLIWQQNQMTDCTVSSGGSSRWEGGPKLLTECCARAQKHLHEVFMGVGGCKGAVHPCLRKFYISELSLYNLVHAYLFSSQMYDTNLCKILMPESKFPVLLDYFYLLWLLKMVNMVKKVTISHD